jgi:hypothetical protein
MIYKTLLASLLAAAMAVLAPSASSQARATVTGPSAAAPAKTLSFDNEAALAGWTLAGDATIDMTKSR